MASWQHGVMVDTQRVMVRLSGPDLDALRAMRVRMQELDPQAVVTFAEVLRGCLRECAGRMK